MNPPPAFKVPKPNYTATPNDLFDHWLPHLKGSELKVLLVIIRKTFGWHKVRDRISLSQLSTLTGMSKRNVVRTSISLTKKGLVLKEISGKNGEQETYYQLVIDDDSNNFDRCQNDTPPSDKMTPPPSDKMTPTKETPSKEKYSNTTYSHTARDLLKVFNESLKKHIPEKKQPCPEREAKHFDELLKHYSAEQIKEVIEFAHTDIAFWQNLILSPKSLAMGKNKDTDRFVQLLLAKKRSEVVVSPKNEVDRRQREADGSFVKNEYEGLF